jgi:hypothetical protein
MKRRREKGGNIKEKGRKRKEKELRQKEVKKSTIRDEKRHVAMGGGGDTYCFQTKI